MRITRRGRLEYKISLELKKPIPNINTILDSVDEYEKANLATIFKLKKDKIYDLRRINGAIKQFLHSHPKLTKELINSLGKRIYGALLSNRPKEPTISARKISNIILKVLGVIYLLRIIFL